MDKQYKPVPDIQALRYHGTPEKPDIKIFVSHRIDLDSQTIDNPLYIPVRCGAVFDGREDARMLGDDTGDNISQKRMGFCELTVQYWAWKNVQADYYGLCHYRRYLSFSNERYAADGQQLVRERILDEATARKYNLLDSALMETRICELDALFQEEFDVKFWPRPDFSRDVYQLWRGLDNLIDPDSLELLMQTLREKYPDYSDAAESYMRGRYFRGFNCFILKKELFDDLCAFEFSILFDIEKKLDTTRSSELRRRTPAYFAEILESIWINKNIIHRKDRKYATTQLVLFEKAQIAAPILPARADNNIPVVLVSSDSYMPYAAVCLQSILYHTSPQYHYDIILLTADMSESHKQILRNMTRGRGNVTVRFCDPEPMLSAYDSQLLIDFGTDVISVYRVALPWLFPDYEKMICLDCDLVLERDIAELFRIPLGEHYLAAVRDVTVQGFVEGANPAFAGYYDDKLRDVANYVNTGVAVYNLSALRKRYALQDVMQAAAKEHYRMRQQDVLNMLVEGNCRLIDERWNVLPYRGAYSRHAVDFAPYEFQQSYRNARKEPFAVHWAGPVKPWQKPDDDMAERFWFYARMSPMYEVILHRLMGESLSPNQSRIRSLADKILPKGTRRREFLKKLLPKGSWRWYFLRKIYYRLGGK